MTGNGRAREPVIGDIYELPSKNRVLIDRKLQIGDCFSCSYLNGLDLKRGKDFMPGVTLGLEFLMDYCTREN